MCPWPQVIVLFCFCSLIISLQAEDNPEGKCDVVPSSPNCRFDCTALVYDMACTGELAWTSVRDDLNILASTGKFLDIYLWNLTTNDVLIEASLFGEAQNKIRRLSLMGTDIIVFPQVQGLTTLTILTIVDAPNLQDLSFESLPDSLQEIEIYHSGITRLENDVEELSNLSHLLRFTVAGSQLGYIQPGLFMVLPELKNLTLKFNTFTITDDIQDDMFKTVKPVEKFTFINNDFTAMTKDSNSLFLQKTLESLQVSSDSVIDLSRNNLPVVFDVLGAIKKLKDVKAFYLQGNPFENSLTITGLFEDFNNLFELDLSDTNLPISVGTFRGLPHLDVLRIGKNNFADMTAVDMFLGSKSTMLRILDLSYNALTSLPEGDLENIAEMLEELILTGNSLLPVEFPANTALLNDSYSKPTFSAFPDLKYLGLKNNNWTQFDGKLLAPLQNLRAVDLSCNFFWYITKDFFDNMPKSLLSINLTFCFPQDADPPIIEENAFSTIPPIKHLQLGSGGLRNWIFDRLRMMPPESSSALQTVLLHENAIKFLSPEDLTGFPNWTTLSLRGNTLQTLGNASFRHMSGLKTLILASNQLINIDGDDLSGVNNLEYLDLQSNRIAHIESGAFDSLNKLKYLYLGSNLLTGLDKIFSQGGGSIVHLGVQKNPVGCITRSDLDPLTGMKWLYMHQVPIPIFVDQGDSRTLRDKIFSTPFRSGDHLNCDLRISAPAFIPLQDIEMQFESDFLRLYVDNPWDLSPRNFIAHLPKCFIPEMRNLTNVTGNFLCPMSDSKTAGAQNLELNLFFFALLVGLGMWLNCDVQVNQC